MPVTHFQAGMSRVAIGSVDCKLGIVDEACQAIKYQYMLVTARRLAGKFVKNGHDHNPFCMVLAVSRRSVSCLRQRRRSVVLKVSSCLLRGFPIDQAVN